jgi:hypothetical protein
MDGWIMDRWNYGRKEGREEGVKEGSIGFLEIFPKMFV